MTVWSFLWQKMTELSWLVSKYWSPPVLVAILCIPADSGDVFPLCNADRLSKTSASTNKITSNCWISFYDAEEMRYLCASPSSLKTDMHVRRGLDYKYLT